MPKMGESVMEGTVLEWKKAVGDTVEQDETLLEISTDKVDSEVPSPEAGTLLEILVEEGDTVDVGTPIAIIGAAGAAASAPVEDEPVLSKNLASTMGTLPNGWNMVAGMRIGGDPLRSPMSDFEAAVEEAQKMGRSCGGLNEEGGSFTLMKAGQVLVSDANCTAYTSSA